MIYASAHTTDDEAYGVLQYATIAAAVEVSSRTSTFFSFRLLIRQNGGAFSRRFAQTVMEAELLDYTPLLRCYFYRIQARAKRMQHKDPL